MFVPKVDSYDQIENKRRLTQENPSDKISKSRQRKGGYVMKASRVIGTLLGILLIVFAVGAYFSDEPASKTDTGRIAILGAFLFGLFTVGGNLGSTTVKKQVTSPMVIPAVALPTCPSCHKPVSNDFTVCPYCATVLNPKCPSCNKEISNDFNLCPYCGNELRK